MRSARVSFAALVVLLAACNQQYPRTSVAVGAHGKRNVAEVARRSRASQREARRALAENARRLELLPSQLRDMSRELEALDSLRIVGMDEGPVPDFELRAGGTQYSSRALVGQQPFVTVFFATWCEYCSVELKAMQHALEQTGPMPVIPVSADGPETWAKVPGYLASFGIQALPVRASEYPRFSASYNPFDTLPLVVVVGRNGGLVDYVLGYAPEHAERLVASLRLAKTIGPLAKPQVDADVTSARP